MENSIHVEERPFSVRTHSLTTTTTLTYILRSKQKVHRGPHEDDLPSCSSTRCTSDIIMSFLDNHPRCTTRLMVMDSRLCSCRQGFQHHHFQFFFDLKVESCYNKSFRQVRIPLHHACIVFTFSMPIMSLNHNSLVSPINLSLHRIPYSQ